MFQLQLDFTPEQQQARGANPRVAGVTPVSARQPLPPGAGLTARRTAGAPAAEAREGLGADAELTPVCAHHVATIGLQTPLLGFLLSAGDMLAFLVGLAF